jgi:hypothetical protein
MLLEALLLIVEHTELAKDRCSTPATAAAGNLLILQLWRLCIQGTPACH